MTFGFSSFQSKGLSLSFLFSFDSGLIKGCLFTHTLTSQDSTVTSPSPLSAFFAEIIDCACLEADLQLSN